MTEKKTKKEVATKDVDTSNINFTYIIRNDGKTISKKFEWQATPKSVVATLLTILINDIKYNVDPSEYKEVLDLIGTQYARELLPELLETPEEPTK